MEVQLGSVGQIRGVFKWPPNSLWPFLAEAFPLANVGESGSQRTERQVGRQASRTPAAEVKCERINTK